jgi:predicted nucleotidyltransferase
VKEAARLLPRAAHSPVKVIVFGSRARGDPHPGSDLDFLVIATRCRSECRSMSWSPTEVEVLEWGGVRRTMVNAALSEGRVIVES